MSTIKNISQKFSGFTLAEVLITIAIIGVVASLILPPLVNDYNDKKFRKSAKQVYSELSDIMIQLKSENIILLRDYVSYNTNICHDMAACRKLVRPLIMSYFKVIKDCGNTYKCIGGNYTNFTKMYSALYPASMGSVSTYMGTGSFITSNGVMIFIPSSEVQYITVDVNGPAKPNKFGVDVFAFFLKSDYNNNIIVPQGAPNTPYSQLQYYCNRTSASGGGFNGLGCTVNTILDKDY